MIDPENHTNPKSSSSAKDEARERTRQSAHEVKDAARQQAEGMFDQQKEVAANEAEKFASVFRKMAKEFDQQDQHYFSGYANNIARCTDGISQRLREKDLGTLMGQVQDYSRRQPAAFIGGAVAAGFLLARFLNSSNARNRDASSLSNTSLSNERDITNAPP